MSVLTTFGKFVGTRLAAGKPSHSTAPAASSGAEPRARRRGRDGVKRVCDVNGNARELGAALAKGGEGEIFPLRAKDTVLVKTYHKHIAGARGTKIEQKLTAMKTIDQLRSSSRFGWPRTLVYDDSRRFRGYAMHRMHGVSMQTLCQPQLLKERLPNWSRREVITCARSFICLVRTAHENGAILGDIQPANFLIDPKTALVRGIDCDSYQVTANGKTYPCPVGIPMLLPPELIGCELRKVNRTVEHDLFSVGIMLFRMLTLGLHPYSRTYGSDPVSNLKSGKCALGTGAGARLPAGPWYNIWSHLSYAIKEQFITTFREGHSDPSRRTTLDEWDRVFKDYEHQMSRGWVDLHLVPSQPKSSKHRGNGDAQAGRVDSPPHPHPSGKRGHARTR